MALHFGPVTAPGIALFTASLLLGCSSSSARSNGIPPADAAADVTGDAGTADAAGLGGYDPAAFGGSRPVKLYVPTKYSPSTPAPLVILLHGYGASGAEEDLYLDLHAVAEADTVLYAHPDGTLDETGKRFWNATDACCDFYGVQVDDVAYLSGLVTEIETRYRVDPKRVYFFGHSNGAFMSYRMACDKADMVASIASLAGAMWNDPSRCKPSQPVSILDVQGTEDQVILSDGGTTNTDSIFDGGAIDGGGVYPPVTATIADWVTLDGCSSTADTSSPNLDIEGSLPGAETKVTKYKTGCRSGTEVDLWSMQGASHIPGFNLSFGPDVFAYLLAHPKP